MPEGLGVYGILAVVFSFIIGIILGGMGVFLLRRIVFNRQMHVAERFREA